MNTTFREKPFLVKIDWDKNIAAIACDNDDYIHLYNLETELDSFRFAFHERFLPDHDWDDEPIELLDWEGFGDQPQDEILQFLIKFLKGD